MNVIKKDKSLLKIVEKVGNKLPHPIYMFIILSIIVIILSMIFNGTEISEEKIIHSLLSKDGINWIIDNLVKNFINFPPLGMVIITMFGIGLGEETGFIGTTLKLTILKAPAKLVTSIVLFVGILGNIAGSAVFIIIPPLAGLIFSSLKRNPILGIIAGYMGVAGGLSANLLITPTDVINSGITEVSARLIDNQYIVPPTANWYFMIVSTFVLTIVGTYIIEKIIEPNLGSYEIENEETSNLLELSSIEKKGFMYAIFSLIIYISLLSLTIIPENGILRGESIINSPFMKGMIPILTLFFFIPSLVYGVYVGKIKNKVELLKLLEKSISNLSGFILLCFFASQFVSIFNYTNFGLLISTTGANFLKSLEIPTTIIIILFILFCTFVNFFIGSLSAKWTILSPIFVPLFMELGLRPEFTQAAFRIADSVTNPISPLEPFMPFILICMQKYKKDYGVGNLISLMLPLTLGFLISWTLLLFIWYIFNLQLGPGSFIFM